MRQIKVSGEEKEKFDAMSSEEQEMYMAQKEADIERATIKSAILVTLLMENLDELSTYSMYRQELKKKGNLFMSQLEKYLDQLFKTKDLQNEEERKNAADFIVHSTKAADVGLEELLTKLTE